jgi:hypothetical protein
MGRAFFLSFWQQASRYIKNAKMEMAIGTENANAAF